MKYHKNQAYNYREDENYASKVLDSGAFELITSY